MSQRNYYYDNLLKTEYKILKYVGLWTEDEQQKNTNCYYVYMLFMNFLYSVYDISHLIQAYLVIDNIPKFAYTCYLFLVMTLIQINSISLYVYRKEVNELNKLIAAEEFQMFTETHKIIVDKNLKTWQTLRKIQYFGVILEVLFFLFSSIVPIIMKQDRSTMYTDYWFPFNTEISPNYELVVVYHLVTCCSSAAAYVSFQFTVAAYFTFISIQCDLLCYNLKHVKENPNENASQFESNLSTCVNHYIKIQKYVNYHFLYRKKEELFQIQNFTH